MRWLAAIVLAAAALAALLGTKLWVGPEAAGTAARPLLPDLDQALPQAVAVRARGARELLVFGSAVDNVGAGPLVVEARRPSRAAGVMTAAQAIPRSDGSRAYRELGPLVRYERAETHSHWHLHGFARYELRSADGSARLLRARKAGFCLGDRYEASGRMRLRGEPPAPVWTDECGKGRPDLLRLTEGISVGYGDDYAPFREGQFVEVTTLPAGRYVLVHLANPGRLLRESDYGNNAASVLLALRRPPGGTPTVDVLARCPARAVCSALP